MQLAPELGLVILQAMQILRYTFKFSLHFGASVFYISCKSTSFHRMLLRVLQNVMGDFSHIVGMSNFKEKHFLHGGGNDHSASRNVPRPS